MTEPMTDTEFALFKEMFASIEDVQSAKWASDGSLLVRSDDGLWVIEDDRALADRVATFLRSKNIPVSDAGL